MPLSRTIRNCFVLGALTLCTAFALSTSTASAILPAPPSFDVPGGFLCEFDMPTAHWDCLATGATAPKFSGWAAHINQQTGVGCSSPFVPCNFHIVDLGVNGWKLVNGAWQAAHLPSGDYYIAPFGSGWSWVWSQSSGWVAVHGKDVYVDVPYSWAVAHSTRTRCAYMGDGTGAAGTHPAFGIWTCGYIAL